MTSRNLGSKLNGECGVYAAAGRGFIQEGIINVGHEHLDPKEKFKVKAGECEKAACYADSAVWVCNDDKGAEVQVSPPEIWESAQTILDACCHTSVRAGTYMSPVHGKHTRPGAKWTAVVAASVCGQNGGPDKFVYLGQNRQVCEVEKKTPS